jgi:predicted nucleic-acid-binding Zn-ribbon protein
MAEQSMKSGVCPKCGSDEVYTFDFKGFIKGAGVVLDTWGRTAGYRHYVCSKCGYMENYVLSRDLHKIKAKWSLVSSVKRKNAQSRPNKSKDDDYFE